MKNTIRVALIGYGLAGRTFHAPLIAATEGLLLVTVVSSDPEKVRLDLPNVTVVDDISAVLDDDGIELVVIATPDHLHATQAIAALDAGKHVVIDKPFAPNLDAARQIAERAAASDRTTAIFHNRRWDADFLTVKRLVAEGALGEIVQFESHFDRFRPTVQDRWKDKREAGVWQDLGPHLVDQALHLFGMPDTVYADLGMQKPGGHAPDYFHVLLRYGERRVILHASQLSAANGLRFSIHGTRGSYIKNGTDPQEGQSASGVGPTAPEWGVDSLPGILTRVSDRGEMQETEIENERGNYAAFYEHVLAAILENGPNPVPPNQALSVSKILELGRVSSHKKCEISVR